MSETLDISNYEFCWIKKFKLDISKVSPPGCKGIGIQKLEFVAKTQFLFAILDNDCILYNKPKLFTD